MFLKFLLCLKNRQSAFSYAKILSTCNDILKSQYAYWISGNQHRCISTSARQEKDSKAAEIEQETLKSLQEQFECNESDAAKVFKTLWKPGDTPDLKQIGKTLEWLVEKGASQHVITQNCKLLLQSKQTLDANFELLNQNKWDDVDDFVPLLALSTQKLKRISAFPLPKNNIPDRIYYFSENFSTEPHVVSKHFVKHTFLFEIEFDLLKRKLITLLEYGVMPEYLLRDLHVFARAEDVIQNRLAYLRQNSIERIMPWMIKCQQNVIERSIEIRNNRGSDQNETLEYLTKTLNWHGKTAISKYSKHKFLQTLSIAKATQLVEVLLTKFTPAEITKHIYLLKGRKSKIIGRIDELKSAGINKYSPAVLAMNKKNYQEFLDFTKRTELVSSSPKNCKFSI